ncbi:hypothetical protein GE09DRAFT_1219166 [Coniochaeta sp. 2T2.1]|nr:hypothetical protein GE09DRAFT_1219166 [Coniochaeta sp. 2T2.1]
MGANAVEEFLIELWVLQGVAFLVVVLRTVSRVRMIGWKNLSWDDLLMALATVVHFGESVIGQLLVQDARGLANNGMTDEERAALDPLSDEYRNRVYGSKLHVAGLLGYTTMLWLLKACWVVYYDRLTAGVHRMRRVILVAYIMVPLTYAICLLTAFLKCIPFDKQWQIFPNPGNRCLPAISTLQTVVVMVLHIMTVLFLMAIPLPMIWKANMPLRRKLMLVVMFSGGFLEMAFSILRCTSILMLGDRDPAQSGYWSLREAFVSIVLTNLPLVYPLVKRFFEKSLSSLGGGKSDNTDHPNSHGYPLGSHPRSGNPKFATRDKHPLFDRGDTVFGSEENIVNCRSNDNADAKTTGTSSSGEDARPAPKILHALGRKLGTTTTATGTATNGRTRSPTSPTELQDRTHDSRNESGVQVSVGAGDPSARAEHDSRGIVVTAEYTVTEHHERESKRLSGSGFAY